MRPRMWITVALILCAAGAHAGDWQIEEILDHQGIGSDCDLAIDSSGGLHVSFEYKHGFLGSSAVNYAYKPNDMGNWSIVTVGSDPSGYTGYDNEIALDSNEYPRIVYVWDIDWEYIPYLKHAWFDGSVWHTQQLTDGTESVEYPTTIGIDQDDYSHVMYGDWYGAGPLHHRWEDATGWNEEVVDTGDCRSAHAVIGPDNSIHVVYFSVSTGAVRYGVNGGSGWTLTTVETDSGVYALSGLDMVLDGSGVPHIVYRGSDREMRHAWLGRESWQVEILHDNALGYPSVAVDQFGTIHTCYSIYTDTSSRPLTYSYKTPGSDWVTEEVESDVQCWNTALDIDPSDRPHIIYYNYDGGRTKHAWGSPVTGVADSHPVSSLVLSPAYPNPARGRTSIAFELPAGAHVELSLYDVSGRRVQMVKDEVMPPGRHVAKIDGLSSGVYLARLTAGEETRTRKLVVLPGSSE